MIVTGNEKWVHGDNPKIIEPATSTVKPNVSGGENVILLYLIRNKSHNVL